jgi:hypothetical protein
MEISSENLGITITLIIPLSQKPYETMVLYIFFSSERMDEGQNSKTGFAKPEI